MITNFFLMRSAQMQPRRFPDQIPKPAQLTPFGKEEQQLYFGPNPWGKVYFLISKYESGQHIQKVMLWRSQKNPVIKKANVKLMFAVFSTIAY